MRVLNPQHMQADIESEHLRWLQSVTKTLNGSVDMGAPTSKNAAGVYNEFEQGNSSGVLIRIGAHGTTEQKYTWGASNVGIPVNHTLRRQPIGFKIVDKDKSVDVYRTAVPDTNIITVAPTDNTANVTLYIF